MNILLVGAGKASITIIDYFKMLDEYNVAGVVDINSDAPGIKHAKENGIATSNDFKELLGRTMIDLIIEITGNDSVRQMLAEAVENTDMIMSAQNTKLMFDIIEVQRKKNAELVQEISERFQALTKNMEQTIVNIDTSFDTIDDLLKESNVIALNASIEANRAGESGRAFGVVSKRFGELIIQIEQALQTISNASQDSKENLQEFNRAEDDLKKMFLSSDS